MTDWMKRVAGTLADGMARCYDLFYPAEEIDQSLHDQLLKDYRSIDEELAQPSNQPVEKEWTSFRQRIRQQMLATPRQFLRRRPVFGLLSLGNTVVAARAWKQLRQVPDWHRYREFLREDAMGAPLRFLFMPSSSGTQIHHTFHLCTFEQETKTRVSQLNLIVEFGGGFGGLCRQLFRAGFNGKYIICDLPELSALQKYYLASLRFNLLPPEKWTDPAANGIVLLQDLDQLSSVVKSLRNRLTEALFIATWSLSEVPMDLREQVLKVVAGFEHYLIAYQPEFGSGNNEEYFQKMICSSDKPDAWHHLPTPYNLSGRYLVR